MALPPECDLAAITAMREGVPSSHLHVRSNRPGMPPKSVHASPVARMSGGDIRDRPYGLQLPPDVADAHPGYDLWQQRKAPAQGRGSSIQLPPNDDQSR